MRDPASAAPGGAERPPEVDLAGVRTVPVQQRPNKVRPGDVAGAPRAGGTFRDFFDSLPDILEARSFRAVVAAIADARRRGRAVVAMLGGHVVKTGAVPVLIDLIRRGVITHLASNGSAVIHDYELARFGGTSEDVEAGLADGTFGMAEETGRELNQIISDAARRGWGLGEAIGRALAEREVELARPDLSLVLAARRHGIGYTVHVAVGADIIHQHPAADGAAIGETSHTDFRRLAAHLVGLHGGGVVLNLGSAVIMPEVFLKALTVCRNLNEGRPREFVAADFDMIRHYRPRVNVVERPTRTGGGRGYQITGHHEIMIPLLGWAVVEALEGDSGG